MKQVMFLCTGNYYRSRFAEIVFNHKARQRNLRWQAISRGLKTTGWGNVGPISEHTIKRLSQLGLKADDAPRMPMRCEACDLENSGLVIALKEAEHRSLLAQTFAGWEERVRYWHVHDIDVAQPETALPELEQLIDDLINELAKRNGSA
jgi:protein-tyrosine phosphatase